VVKRPGDGLFAEFRSVVDAMRCAVEVQNAMGVSGLGWSPASPSSAWPDD
jgi:adenylate cyclase